MFLLVIEAPLGYTCRINTVLIPELGIGVIESAFKEGMTQWTLKVEGFDRAVMLMRRLRALKAVKAWVREP